MTKETLDKANALNNRIYSLKQVLEEFKSAAAKMDSSLTRMTRFNIDGTCSLSRNDFHHNIDQGELLFLIAAYEKEIARLERELEFL